MAIRPSLEFTVSNHHKLLSPFLLTRPSFFSASPSKPLLLLLRRIAYSATPLTRPNPHRPQRPLHPATETLAQKICKSIRRPGAASKARIYSDVNVIRPKEYWDYEALTVQWGSVTCVSLPFLIRLLNSVLIFDVNLQGAGRLRGGEEGWEGEIQ